MNRGVWVGALALGLGGWMSSLGAQEASWRSVLRPPPPPEARTQEVTIGRPVPIITRASGSDSDWSERAIARPIATHGTRSEQPGRVAQPGEVIATSSGSVPQPVRSPGSHAIGQVSHEEMDEGGGDGFAAERAWPPSLIKPVGDNRPAPELPLGTMPPLAGMPEPGNWGPGHPTTLPPLPPSDEQPGGAGQTRYWLMGEYLLWWVKKADAPPLFTTSTDPNDQGILDRATTSVVLGGPIGSNPLSGARLSGGMWLDDCQQKGIDFSGFFLGQRTARASFNSSQFATLARPFLEFNRGIESVELINSPGVFTGRATLEAPTQLWGLDANLICNLGCCCDVCGVDCPKSRDFYGLAGFRYLNLKEALVITENVSGADVAQAGSLRNSTDTVIDSFQTRNQFYGGQVGLGSRWYRGDWSLDLKGKLALGVTDQQITINGSQVLVNRGTGVVTTSQGGLLALPGANIGTFDRTQFCVVPEVGVNIGYQILPNIRASVGYNFLYWSNVVRPGDQIDRALDITRIPNFQPLPAGVTPRTDQIRPAVPFKDSDFWAHGLTVGLEINW